MTDNTGQRPRRDAKTLAAAVAAQQEFQKLEEARVKRNNAMQAARDDGWTPAEISAATTPAKPITPTRVRQLTHAPATTADAPNQGGTR